MAAVGNHAAHGETASQRQPAVGQYASTPIDAALDVEQKHGAATVGVPAAVDAGAPIGQRTAVGKLAAVGGCNWTLYTLSCINKQRGPERPGPNSIDHRSSGLVFFQPPVDVPDYVARRSAPLPSAVAAALARFP